MLDSKLYASPVTLIPSVENDDDSTYQWTSRMNPLPPDAGDILDGPRLRYLAYMEAWTKCSRKIERIVQETNGEIANDLLHFVQSSNILDGFVLPILEIPVALIVGDTNQTTVVVEALSIRFKEANRTKLQYVSMGMSSKDFSSVLLAMRSLITGFTSQSYDLGLQVPQKKAHRASLPNHDITMLLSWYEHLCHEIKASPRLVVSIPTVELCEGAALRDFLYICSIYIDRLPLVFLVGTGTSTQILQTILPLAIRTKISVETFQLKSSSSTFESVMAGLFLDYDFDLILQLSATTFEQLHTGGSMYHQSLDGLQSTLQLVLIDHFGVPRSVFCASDMLGEEAVAQQLLQASESKTFFRHLQRDVQRCIVEFPNSLASVELQSAIEPPHSQSNLSVPGRQHAANAHLSEVHCLAYVTYARQQFEVRAYGFIVALHLLRTLILELRASSSEMRASLTALLAAALNDKLWRNEVEKVFAKIRQAPLERLVSLSKVLKKFYHRLSSYPRSLLQALHDEAEQWTESLHHITPDKPSPAKNVFKPGGNVSFNKLPGSARSPEVVSAAKTLADLVEAFLREYLSPMDNVPFKEIWQLDSKNSVVDLLNPAPRYDVTRVLSETHKLYSHLAPSSRGWKGRANWSSNDAEALFNLPDTAILFRRYLDSGRMLNAYDWFESFTQALSGEQDDEDEMQVGGEDEEEAGKLDEERQNELQARFLRSAHEMDWMGLLKSTGRKRDHFARTLFNPPPTA